MATVKFFPGSDTYSFPTIRVCIPEKKKKKKKKGKHEDMNAHKIPTESQQAKVLR